MDVYDHRVLGPLGLVRMTNSKSTVMAVVILEAAALIVAWALWQLLGISWAALGRIAVPETEL